jgi:hypothetical protein
MEQLNSLSYLEGVVREALRLYAPVSNSHRIAMHDAEIPLQKPFTDKQGVLRGTVRYAQPYLDVALGWEGLSFMRQGVERRYGGHSYSTVESLDRNMG